MTALVCLSYGVGCGLAARQIGESATAGAIEEAREQEQQAIQEEGETPLAQLTGEQVTQGIISALTAPEAVTELRQLVDALIRQSLRSMRGGGVPSSAEGPVAAAGPGTGGAGPGLGGAGAAGQGPVPALAADMARALAMELEQRLGPDGQGPLARSLAATAGEVASAVVAESRNEFGLIFPECEGLQGPEARACMDARLGELGAAFTRGATEGIREALRPWLLLLAFGGGLLVGLLLFLAVSAVRLNREAGGGAGLFRQRRHA